ncbi:37S ribosomal protein S24, mitochondrial OS=Saccharomyces cerevisiae (strain ATCC 204508 / S288c) GN=RSM24 PE=1 SV=1 [Rhizoctonia solani AG-1 IB]|uniref:37S ribosomal protein S24, mitochondrial n=1 Tax=Thanatephorus cucumeris (strain AG1-IB / isolate 7/3/14) TaxID=1108050 RepID=A0A0B7FBJ5_THACB|nr:37S ribosomal protein S24, mitochondrial OS=Saccharomyces cerevisiae (strain ATCC 204508 / S288c) GN=RSM24 PE=1 SV=1 [Rhizoctonia solani AG-1 IB]
MSLPPLGLRLFSTSSPALAVTRRAVKNKWDIAKIGPNVGNDSTSVGHRLIRERRELLHYLRLIEYDIPRLSRFKKSFQPPTSKFPLSIRTFTYGGEPHAAEHKAVLVVPVSQLSLRSPEAIHKFKLLAGVRWSEAVPRDAGFSIGEVGNPSFAEHGYIKISSEHFPEVRMNVKWCSDTLDEMIKQANDSSADSFSDIPLDKRHLISQQKKRRQGGHSFSQTKRATIQDFPQEWLHAAS